MQAGADRREWVPLDLRCLRPGPICSDEIARFSRFVCCFASLVLLLEDRPSPTWAKCWSFEFHVPMRGYQRLGLFQAYLSNVFSSASQSAFIIQQSEAYFVRR